MQDIKEWKTGMGEGKRGWGKGKNRGMGKVVHGKDVSLGVKERRMEMEAMKQLEKGRGTSEVMTRKKGKSDQGREWD